MFSVLCLSAGGKNESHLKIAATIFPLSDIAGQISSGTQTQVVTILPAGANPHTFELSPRTIKELEGTRIVFVIGRGFDDWIKAVAESLPLAQAVAVDRGIDFIKPGSEDPHYWLSITNAKIVAKNIAHKLAELEPHNKNRYEANLARYLSQLDEVDQNIRNLLSNLRARKIMTFHNGWQYFAREYGFEIVGTVEPSLGGEPTPKRLAHLDDLIREHQIKVLFSEPAVSKAVAESVAKDFNVRLFELDPIGGSSGADFLDLMKANAEVVHEALSYG
ncbi:MAG: zinc ABC transporter substrate-binding protein [Candidatus Omnitrophica bacterium]|nr:zinc ABC transporter substrate-binding protein [Candidatus Omnitrophota bacterium]